LKTEKEIELRLSELRHIWSSSNNGRELFKSQRHRTRGELKALEWVLK
jgi:hypothetical protein